MKCPVCQKNNPIFAEGMCVECYRKSELAKQHSQTPFHNILQIKKLEKDLKGLKGFIKKKQKNPYLKHIITSIIIIISGAMFLLILRFVNTKPDSFQGNLLLDETREEIQPITPEEEIKEINNEIDPFIDSDDDRIPDIKEINKYFTDPYNADTDGDGLTDYEEIVIYRTDPDNPDTDGGGAPDGEEIAAGNDPLDPSDDYKILSSDLD